MKTDLIYLRNIKTPEVTTKMLMGVLSRYSDPRKKINSLARMGWIQSVKQGVYIMSEDLGLRPYSKEILAQLIYGPSYISLETALSNYGLIPERVETTTSICLGRGKSFSTPVGNFEYHHVKDSLYSCGVQLREIFQDSFCLYATPEKALLDFVYIRETKKEFKHSKEYFDYLTDSYRFDIQAIANEISLRKLSSLVALYPFQNIRWFVDELTREIIK
jgi:hypothetical protein